MQRRDAPTEEALRIRWLAPWPETGRPSRKHMAREKPSTFRVDLGAIKAEGSLG
jgi:hypothetical protein